MAKEKAFIKRLIFRLIKKKIAGSTINTAFNATKDINARHMQATITFLNEGDSTPQKARYNLMSYMELANRIGRLHINASVSLRLSQISYGNNVEANLSKLAEHAKMNGVMLWLEHERPMRIEELAGIYARHFNECNLGMELPIKAQGIERIEEKLAEGSNVKLISRGAQAPAAKGKKQKSIVELYVEHASMLAKKPVNVWISEGEEKTVSKVAQMLQYRKNLIFELPLGYNKKWQSKLSSKGVKMSVYVPYGKDWIPYAINRLTEGHIRDIALTLLDGRSNGKKGR
ncbi:MAG: hypothetical protein QXI95_01915 [Candidatus Micrarchaeaceae archaeon]